MVSEKLTKHFKKYGEIIDSVIMRDRATGHTRGFGFVTYSDPSVVDRVIQDKHVLDGKTVSIEECFALITHVVLCFPLPRKVHCTRQKHSNFFFLSYSVGII